MRYLIQLAVLAMIGALGFYAAITLSPDAISLLFGMAIMLLASLSVSVAILAAQRDRDEVRTARHDRQMRQMRLDAPPYFVIEEPIEAQRWAQAKRIEVIK